MRVHRHALSLGAFLLLAAAPVAHADSGSALLSATSVGCATPAMSLINMAKPEITGNCLPGIQSWLYTTPSAKGPGLNGGAFAGEIIQPTTKGVFIGCMFAMEQWAQFTDGNYTWALGPLGVMRRKNGDLLPYPYDRACDVPLPANAGDGGDPSGSGGSGGSSGCASHISSATTNNGNDNINAVAIATCASNATVIVNVSTTQGTSTGTASTGPTSSSTSTSASGTAAATATSGN